MISIETAGNERGLSHDILKEELARACDIASRKLEPSLAENLREIMNVCSQLFVASESGRITLQSVTLVAQCDSEEAKRMVSVPSQKSAMKLSIEGYGDGMVSLLT